MSSVSAAAQLPLMPRPAVSTIYIPHSLKDCFDVLIQRVKALDSQNEVVVEKYINQLLLKQISATDFVSQTAKLLKVENPPQDLASKIENHVNRCSFDRHQAQFKNFTLIKKVAVVFATAIEALLYAVTLGCLFPNPKIYFNRVVTWMAPQVQAKPLRSLSF